MKRVALFALLFFVYVTSVAGCPNNDKNPAIMAENEKLKLRNQELLNDKDELGRKLNLIAEERNEWRDKYNSAQAKLDELQNIVAKLKIESADLKARLDELERKNQKLETERGSLENKLRDIEGVKVELKGNDLCVTLENKILFDSGKADLKPGALNTIKQIAAVVASDFPNRHLRIEGHTDTDLIRASSKFRSNWELSSERACSVLHALAKSKLDPSKMSVAGFAFYRPIAPNDTAKNKARNRRVEIYILPE